VSNTVQVLFDKDTGKTFLGQGGGLRRIPAGWKLAIGYRHVQHVSSQIWNIIHNGGTLDISVAGIFNINDEEVIPDKIFIIDQNTVRVHFAEAMIGTARLIAF